MPYCRRRRVDIFLVGFEKQGLEYTGLRNRVVESIAQMPTARYPLARCIGLFKSTWGRPIESNYTFIWRIKGYVVLKL